jgi:hypothetical protein
LEKNNDKNWFYVYEHFEPTTGEIVYIGKGSGARAWQMGTYTQRKGYRGHRRKDHNEWAENLMKLGYTADQFVRIIHRGLSKKEALDEERNFLPKRSLPRFNDLPGNMRDNIKLWGPGTYFRKRAELLREEGVSYSKIAMDLGVTAMTVWKNLHKEFIG